MVPFFQAFFFNKLVLQIEKRRECYKQLMDKKNKFSLYRQFEKAGLDMKKPHEPNITYRMVEMVLINIKSYY